MELRHEASIGRGMSQVVSEWTFVTVALGLDACEVAWLFVESSVAPFGSSARDLAFRVAAMSVSMISVATFMEVVMFGRPVDVARPAARRGSALDDGSMRGVCRARAAGLSALSFDIFKD
eukprot:scaffold15499_cov56-Phaeocystis_antarctica.AAC.1